MGHHHLLPALTGNRTTSKAAQAQTGTWAWDAHAPSCSLTCCLFPAVCSALPQFCPPDPTRCLWPFRLPFQASGELCALHPPQPPSVCSAARQPHSRVTQLSGCPARRGQPHGSAGQGPRVCLVVRSRFSCRCTACGMGTKDAPAGKDQTVRRRQRAERAEGRAGPPGGGRRSIRSSHLFRRPHAGPGGLTARPGHLRSRLPGSSASPAPRCCYYSTEPWIGMSTNQGVCQADASQELRVRQ